MSVSNGDNLDEVALLKRDHDTKTYRVGVFWSFVSAFLWSTTFVSGRYLMRDACVDPVSLSLIRFSIGGVLLFALGCLFFKKQLFSVTLRDIAGLALLALFGILGMSVLLFFGQRQSTAINSAMIMQLNPIIILFGGVLVGESITRRQIGGVFVSLLGCLFVLNVVSGSGFGYDFNHLEGDVIILASASCWAVYSIFGKKMVKKLGGFTCTTWAMLLGAAEIAVLLFVLPIEKQLPTTTFHWSIIIYLAVFPTAVAFFAWYEAMDKIELSLLNVMQYLTPVFTVALAWMLLGESFNFFNALGVILVVAGVVLTSKRK
jgi:drug/metabolite transporter (DMT)-like permease